MTSQVTSNLPVFGNRVILRESDWDYFPNAILHRNTRNKTFLETAELYRSMGVKNYYFHLALLNPLLEFVDPHADNLTQEQRMSIGIECRFNPWYYFREVVRIAPMASIDGKPFRADRGNLALFWCFFNHIDIALIQPRQTGKSVGSDTLMGWLLKFGASNTTINLLTKDNELRKKNVARLKKMLSLLPSYLNNTLSSDADNKEEITCNFLGNHYLTSIGQNNTMAAANMGRGLSSAIMQIDEGPFIGFMPDVVPAMLSSGNAAREEAEENGTYYGTVFTTTAGKLDSVSGKYMYEMFSGGMPWSELALLDLKSIEEVQKVVRKGSPGHKAMVYAVFSHKQLGKTDEWLIKAMQETNSTGAEADRDYFNKWTSGGTSSPLTPELNDMIRSSQKDPQYVEIHKDGYAVNWYIPKEQIENRLRSKHHVIGMDTSEAIGRDAITMLLIDPEDLSLIAASACNETNLIRYSNFIADFMIRYEKTVLIPERKSTGTTIIDTLMVRLPMHGIDPFRRIYNRIVDEHTEMESEFREIQTGLGRRPVSFYDRFKKYFGYNTSGSGKFSRTALYSEVFQTAARRGGTKVHCKELIDEITKLEVKNGKIDHASSGHDDHVIAWLLVVWMLTMSRNLKYYGLENVLRFAHESNGGKPLDPYAEYMMEKQRGIRAELEQQIEELKASKSDYDSIRIEHRIRFLNAQLTDEFVAEVSIDSLINEAKRSKTAQQRFRGSYDEIPINRQILNRGYQKTVISDYF